MIRIALERGGLIGLAALSPSWGSADERAVLPLPIYGVSTSSSAPRSIAESDSFPLELLANLDDSVGAGMAFGDTDHDGDNELAFIGFTNFFRIWENQGDNVYALVDSQPLSIICALGDTDADGRDEVIGQTSGYIQIFESANASSHPSTIVWESPYISNVGGGTTIADSDRDGRMELIHSINNSGGLVIFENVGDNAYSVVFSTTLVGPSATGYKLVADFDGDGLLEFALCGSPGWLHVFESPADNTWVLTFRQYTGMLNAYTVVGGRDTDENGKPEMFVEGTITTESGHYFDTMVYESTGDNSFIRVDEIVLDQGIGSTPAVVANVDGEGREEYLRRSGPGIRVFRADTPGQWDLVATAYGPGGGPYSYDLNKDGLPEVIWPYFTTRIFQHPFPATDVPEHAWQPARLDVIPNPCRVQAALQLPAGAETAAALVIFDVRGRIVERHAVDGAGRSIVWRPRNVPAGVYLVRLEDRRGRTIASGRGTVVR